MVRGALKEVFPRLRHIWLTDPKYDLPSLEDLEERLKGLWPEEDYEPRSRECEEFALFLHADVKRLDKDLNWAFGEAFAKRLNGQNYLHVVNICVCKEGVFLIDAKAKEIRPARKNDDLVFFVRM